MKTGLSMSIAEDTYARVASLTGDRMLLGRRCAEISLVRIQVGAGVVDSDYRGEVGVVLYNHSPEEHTVESLVLCARSSRSRRAMPWPSSSCSSSGRR